MSWAQIGRWCRTVFLLRAPLITLLLLAGLGPLALFRAEKMLGNLFDLRVAQLPPSGTPTVAVGWTEWYLFTVAFAAFTLAWTAVAVINLVLHYGRDRFQDPVLELDQKRPWQTFFLGLCSALVLVSCAVLQTKIDSSLRRYGMPLLGFLCSIALVIGAKVIQLGLTDPQTTPHPPPYLVFPVYTMRPLERFFDRIYCWHSAPSRRLKGQVNGFGQWLLEIFRGAGEGYFVDRQAPVGKLNLRSGHVFAIALSSTALGLYLGIGYFKGRIDSKPAFVPALAFFLLFLIVACWCLGALTFFFDRYRVPLLACLAILSLATTYAPESDHFYRVEVGRGPPALLRPSAVVLDHGKRGHKRLIAVATAGGGIQAAAWTARVLRGLEEECSQVLPAAGCDLRDSVVLISGVSGGSLGAMAYARSYATSPSSVAPEAVVGNAEASAIDEVAWGWTVPDLFRTVLPWFGSPYIDRGWALEEKWKAVHQLHDAQRKRDVFLGDWAASAGNSMPALLLNATVVETGRPILFSTTDFPRKKDSRGLVNFYDLFPLLHRDYDIRVNTAARLSASFPFVAPAARSNATTPPVPDYHIVDGGYYDNYGMVALLGWLQNAIEDSTVSPPIQQEVQQDLADVLVLQIKPFPSSADPAPHDRHGWGFQLVAPMDGMLDVRDIGQAARDDTELALFTRAYRQNVKVWRADFIYPQKFGQQHKGCLEAPLSWKLSLDQLDCIGAGWDELKDEKQGSANPEIGCVLNFLRGDSNGSPSWLCKPGDVPYE